MDPVTAIFNFLSTPAGQKVVETGLAAGLTIEQVIANLIGYVLTHPLILIGGNPKKEQA